MAGAAVKVCVALAVVWTASVEGQEDGSFWWLTNTTTAATTATSASGIRCQCVPFFQCVDGVITTSGEGLIDIRFGGTATPPEVNVDVCSDVIQVCCNLPGTGESSHTTPAPTITTTLPPDTPCDCVPLLDCKDPNRLVSDGKGNTSLGLFGSNYSHSKCQGAFEVCCASEATGLPQKEEECVCVTSNLCGDDGYVVTDGEGLINIRHGGGTPSVHHPLPSGECPDVGQVCCKQPPTTTTPILTSTAPPLPDCGWRNVGGVRVRVLGFKEGESQFGEYPWVATILKPTPKAPPPTLEFVGGATLIHPRVVVTAAHKIFSERQDELVVRLGEWDTEGETEPYRHQDFKVSRVIMHESFNPTTLFYDVALLVLEEEVVLQSHINTICLADELSDVDWSSCVINGWGVNAFGTNQYQAIMKSLTLPLVDSDTCQSRLRTTRLGLNFNLHSTFLCAGGEAGKDACKGDGGGPLACPRLSNPSGYYELVGLTAWGVGCGREGLPGVYVNIPSLKHWITTAVNEYANVDGHRSGDLQTGGSEDETVAEGGGAGAGGREEKRRRNQERRAQRQQERREERQRQREERMQQREQRKQERQERRNRNRNGRK